MKLCAARTGCILNINSLANNIGVSHHAVKHWLSILQASFIIRLIPAYFENFVKQVIKSAKLYFNDVGLACYLLEIETTSQIDRDPLRGHFFEKMVIMELVKARLNQGKDAHLYYYRDSQKNEIDIIYKYDAKLVPIDIKSVKTISQDFFNGLSYFSILSKDRRAHPALYMQVHKSLL